MAGFAYTALTADGQLRRGHIEADDAVAAQRQLELQQLIPTEVTAHRRQGSGQRLPQAQVLHFTRSLAGLLKSGVPLSRALSVIERETKHAAARENWSDIHARVRNGADLADALAAQDAVFPTVFIAMVRAGEAGGFIDVVLEQVASYIDRQRDLRGRLLSALAYPVLLAVIACSVVGFLLVWFIPRFADLFASFDHALPLLTQWIQALSFALVNHSVSIVIALVLVAIALRFAFMHAYGRALWDRWRLRLPLMGPISSGMARVRFCRMLGTLLGAGVPLLSALKVSGETLGNALMHDALEAATEAVRQGTALSVAIQKIPDLLPSSALETIAVAEASGRLSEELLRLADSGETELDRRLRTMVALVEPLLLLGMAIVVGTIVIGMLMPIFDLWSAVK